MPTPLGERVRELRLKRGLTLEALAERVGSSKSYMWEIENKDVARPSAEKLALIATALGTTVEYLLAGDGVKEEDAEDIAFFRKYKKMDAPAKERLRRILDALDAELIAEVEAAEGPLTQREAWRLALIATGGRHEALTYHVCGALMGSLDAAIRCLPEHLGEGRFPAAALVAAALRARAQEGRCFAAPPPECPECALRARERRSHA